MAICIRREGLRIINTKERSQTKRKGERVQQQCAALRKRDSSAHPGELAFLPASALRSGGLFSRTVGQTETINIL